MFNLTYNELNKLFPELTYKQSRVCVLLAAGISPKILSHNDDVTIDSLNKMIIRSAEKLQIKKADIRSVVILRLLLNR